MGTRGVTPEECRFLKVRMYKNNIKIYDVLFHSVGDIQLFLRTDPDRNREVFQSYTSELESERTAGVPLEQAIDYCLGGYEEKFDQFLQLGQQLENVNKRFVAQKRTETTFVGQRPNVPAYIAGAPKNMYRTVRSEEKKQINVFMNVTYRLNTTPEQIQHRGIISLNMIRMLEQNGYIVNFRLFECCAVHNEVFLCEVVLKKPGENLNPRLCYYPMCGKSFLRRVLARIKESMPFEENWQLGYGNILPEQLIKKLVGIGEDDIYIGSPEELHIAGKNIYQDADAFLKKLNLSDRIVIPTYGE